MDKLIEFLQNHKDFKFNFSFKKYYSANEILSLRKKYKNYPINEILSQIQLRNKVKNKFENPGDMIFTRKGAEQATTWQIAKYHAEKLKKYNEIADLCCGIGSDLLYL